MINFTNISIQGFGSFINEVNFKLDRRGLNIIKGKVGSGKTTVPSALSWCIYGTNLKVKSSIETWEKLRDDNYQGTKVEVSFTKNNVEYKIIRCVNYKKKIHKVKGGNNLFIEVNNELMHSERNKGDKQNFINNLIGYSFDLFVNSIIFGQRMKKIIEETGPIKKKIFEEAFEVTFIEEARKTTKAKLDNDISLFSKLNYTKNQLEENIVDIKEDLRDAIQFEKEFLKNKKTRIQKLKGQRTEYKDLIAQLTKELKTIKTSDIKVFSDKLEKLTDKLNKADRDNRLLDKLKSDITRLEDEETELHNKGPLAPKLCPTCGGELSFKKSQKLLKERQERLLELDAIINDKRNELLETPRCNKADIQKQIDGITTLLNNAKINQGLYKVKKDSLDSTQDKIRCISSELKVIRAEELKVSSSKYTKKLEIANEKLKELEKELVLVKESRDINDWLVKDPLSNNGLKAYIFDSLLGKVNNYLNDYSHILGFKVEFGIDLQSSRKDFYQTITKDDITIIYEDLSGGQKQLVDTSVALAIHSVISSIRPINIIFMDEPFEGLDEETVEIVSELIDYKCKHQCLYLITHHSSFNPVNAKKITMKLSSKGYTIVL